LIKSILVESKKGEESIYDDKRTKVEFYIISLWLLFFLMIILTIDVPISLKTNSDFIGFDELIKRNRISIISLSLLIYSMILCAKYKYKFKGTMQLPLKIIKLDNINYEHLTFLTTYIIPLICVDIRQIRYFIVFIILLFIIGCIYIKTDLFYANPTLALLNYYIYKVETNDVLCPNAIFISNGKLTENQSVQYIQLDKKIYYVGRIKE